MSRINLSSSGLYPSMDTEESLTRGDVCLSRRGGSKRETAGSRFELCALDPVTKNRALYFLRVDNHMLARVVLIYFFWEYFSRFWYGNRKIEYSPNFSQIVNISPLLQALEVFH